MISGGTDYQLVHGRRDLLQTFNRFMAVAERWQEVNQASRFPVSYENCTLFVQIHDHGLEITRPGTGPTTEGVLSVARDTSDTIHVSLGAIPPLSCAVQIQYTVDGIARTTLAGEVDRAVSMLNYIIEQMNSYEGVGESQRVRKSLEEIIADIAPVVAEQEMPVRVFTFVEGEYRKPEMFNGAVIHRDLKFLSVSGPVLGATLRWKNVDGQLQLAGCDVTVKTTTGDQNMTIFQLQDNADLRHLSLQVLLGLQHVASDFLNQQGA